ncbi:MAG: hypoxanthine phosphoribosyltransferase [Defluviitaleaceae bacterium]|nr:hypoxanthine phosphoribosyltransferase [Defluviitaleaceae bacterium]
MINHSDAVEVLISADRIAARVKQIADQIVQDYRGKTVTLLGVLKGGVMFTSDLARAIEPLSVELEFIKVSSYDDKMESSGNVRLEYPKNIRLKDRHIIIVEDIVDMGYTAAWLRKYIMEQKAASVKLCALLDKPQNRQVGGVKIDYLGFTIENDFVVGYGLDFADWYRNMPFVGLIKKFQ